MRIPLPQGQREGGGRGAEGEQQLEEPEPEGNQWCCKNVLQVKTESKNGLRLQVEGERGKVKGEGEREKVPTVGYLLVVPASCCQPNRNQNSF